MADNNHEVAQWVARAWALLTSSPEGETASIDSDVENPERILA